MTGENNTRCGFAAIIGLPNAGKSTLLNALIGMKVSIVSHKKQTTRSRIAGIITKDATQVVVVDTPGVFSAKKSLDKLMVKAAWGAMAGVNAALHVVDVSHKDPLGNNKAIVERLPDDTPVFLVLNKIDKIPRDKLLGLAKSFSDAFAYQEVMMISALKGQGVTDLLEKIEPLMPESPWMYEEDQVSDVPLQFMCAEITREKVYEQLHEEIPYAVFVNTENWERFDNGDIKISQVIFVEKDSQKGIVLGKGGSRIKSIGAKAREDMQELTQTRVHLKLFVKVDQNWASRAENIRNMGLDL